MKSKLSSEQYRANARETAKRRNTEFRAFL